MNYYCIEISPVYGGVYVRPARVDLCYKGGLLRNVTERCCGVEADKGGEFARERAGCVCGVYERSVNGYTDSTCFFNLIYICISMRAKYVCIYRALLMAITEKSSNIEITICYDSR